MSDAILTLMMVTRDVLTYLKYQGNKAEGYCTDQCGRFVLPLDNVTFGYYTDEGPQVLLNGIVRDVSADWLLIEPYGDFGMCWQSRTSDSCIKHPKGQILLSELLTYFSATNGTVFQGRTLHINGKKSCFVA